MLNISVFTWDQSGSSSANACWLFSAICWRRGALGSLSDVLLALVTPEGSGGGSSDEVLNLVDSMQETQSPVQELAPVCFRAWSRWWMKVTWILWIYFAYPSGEEPGGCIWKEEAELKRWLGDDCQFSQLTTARGYLLAWGETLGVHHCPRTNCSVPWCLNFSQRSGVKWNNLFYREKKAVSSGLCFSSCASTSGKTAASCISSQASSTSTWIFLKQRTKKRYTTTKMTNNILK